MTHPIRLLCLILAIAFTALIGWASVRGDFGAEFAAITAMPWGFLALWACGLGRGKRPQDSPSMGRACYLSWQCVVARLGCCALAANLGATED
eukprot:gene14221-19083_t